VALRKKETMRVEEERQETLDLHLRERPSKPKVIPYSDELFRQAAIEWLIETDQVCASCTTVTQTNMYLANPGLRAPEVQGDD
jgi:hypothetical protein